MRFDGRVAVVTGAGRGLGRAYALLLAERGAAVVVNDLGGEVDGSGQDPGPAQDVVREIEAAGGAAAVNAASVTSEEGATSIVETALNKFGRVDIVINNAGILTPTLFPEMTLDDLARHMDVHLNGSFNVTRAAWPHMQRQHYGRVILTASPAVLGRAPAIAYTTAKGALYAFGRGLASIGPPDGVNVNVIAPIAETRMRFPGFHNLAGAEGERPHFDLGQGATPEAVAPAVIYLVHESCPVNGELVISGRGRVARMFLAENRGIVGISTPEEVRDNWTTVCAEEGYIVPIHVAHHAAFEEEILSSGNPAT